MNIDFTNPITGQQADSVNGVGTSKPRKTSGTAAQDDTLITGRGVLSLKAQILGLPEVRQDKVEALKAAIDSGEYHPTDSSIAEAMVSHLLVSKAPQE
jgi:flagellar biosynthesis anti-sigma factor FlgM